MDVHALMIRKFNLRCRLEEAACRAVEATPFTMRTIAGGVQIVREGSAPTPYCSFMIEGLAMRYKMTGIGARQIVAIETPGDFLDLQHLFLAVADHHVEALTPIRVANVDRAALKKLALEHPAIGHALWVEALIEGSIAREWLTNIGRRDARTRVAHILCEMAVRSEAIGLTQPDMLTLPWTQEQLGDVIGLTSVHVNRMLKSLDSDGLIAQTGRQIRILDREGLRRVGDFDPRYLHLDQVDPIA